MRPLISLALLAFPWPLTAWDTLPHQKITWAALDSLPPDILDSWGREVEPLVSIYCMYPDRYTEMDRFGFVRKSRGPRTAAEIRLYCVRPDGQPIHGATGDRDLDTASLVYLFERIVTSISVNRPGEAARYAGVLSHFIADSLSPPHSVDPEELLGMADGRNVHSDIERSMPEFTLSARQPRILGEHLVPAARAMLEQCYAGAERNRKELPAMVKAACARDERTLDTYRLRAGTRTAEILADALYSLVRLADSAR
ncbi:MAG TPA: hypothetical protein VGH38_19580 [Bryobacteraceae bacterium]